MYIDGFVVAVPAANLEAYRKMAAEAAAIYREHGALSVVECWGDDVPAGKLTSFPLAVQCREDEVVVFSWVIWPSREVRDAGKAVLLVSVELDEIMSLSDRIMVMYGGQIGEHATIAELFDNPRHPYTRALLDAIPVTNPRDRRIRTFLQQSDIGSIAAGQSLPTLRRNSAGRGLPSQPMRSM